MAGSVSQIATMQRYKRSDKSVSPSPYDDGGLRGCFSHEPVVADALRPSFELCGWRFPRKRLKNIQKLRLSRDLQAPEPSEKWLGWLGSWCRTRNELRPHEKGGIIERF